jgi:hypothetical protein
VYENAHVATHVRRVQDCRMNSILRCALPLVLALFAACKSTPPPAPPQSVKPGINKDFLDPALDPQKFVERFETESREIFTERAAIAAMVGLKPGQRVADIGAGTGLFTLPFAEAVGPQGHVFAVDIAPAFVERIETMASEKGLRNVEGVVKSAPRTTCASPRPRSMSRSCATPITTSNIRRRRSRRFTPRCARAASWSSSSSTASKAFRASGA